ncbi:MAG TPA: hypothetical protein ENO01_01985, partial [Candidatus Marinimicrobia bacterium]|nr:hypothetical protein [Candidatus Neomarinimicrobiota bacterium]
MNKAVRLIPLLFIIASSLYGIQNDMEAVFFSPDTPYPDKIYQILEKSKYRMVEDSALAVWTGSLLMTDLNDSLRYEVVLEKESGLKIVAGEFYLKPADKKVVIKQLKDFSLWFTVTNLLLIFL